MQMLAVLAMTWLALQQVPARDPVRPPAPVRTAIIHGRVLDAAGTPLGGAVVTVAGVDPGGARTALSSTDGNFRIEGLPPGRFMVSASRSGFARADFGQPAPHLPGTPVVVAPGARVQANITLTRGSVVAGTVVDERGAPFPEVTISVHRPTRGDGRPQWVAGTGADADGSFRVWGLQAGEYLVRAAARSAGGAGPTTDVTVTLGAAEERRLQLTLAAGGGGSSPLSGSAAAIDGRPFDQLDVRLIPPSHEWFPSPTMGPAGAFRFRAVPRGRYRLAVRGMVFDPPAPGTRSRRSTRYWGFATVDVDGEEPPPISVTLRPGVSISGSTVLRSDSPAPKSGPMYFRLVSLDVPSDYVSSQLSRRDEPDGRFTIHDVPAGRYRIEGPTYVDPSQGWRIDSAILAGVDMLESPVAIGDKDVHGLVVTFTDRRSPVHLTLRDQTGAPVHATTVIAYPVDSKHWRAGSLRLALARPDTAGELSIDHLPPGEYFLAASGHVPADWEDSTFLKRLEPSARIRLLEGQTTARTLTVGR